MKNKAHTFGTNNSQLLLLLFSVSSYATVKDCTPDKVFTMDFNKKISGIITMLRANIDGYCHCMVTYLTRNADARYDNTVEQLGIWKCNSYSGLAMFNIAMESMTTRTRVDVLFDKSDDNPKEIKAITLDQEKP